MIKMLADYAAYMMDAGLTGIVSKIQEQGFATFEDAMKLKDCIYFLQLECNGNDRVSIHRRKILKNMAYIANNI